MRQYPIRSRYISLLLLVAMFFSLVPTMQFTASAAHGDSPNFLSASSDGVTMLPNNDNEISMSVQINNFVMDGMLFDYLSSTRSANNADDYYWEYSKNYAYMQIYPYWLTNTLHGDAELDEALGNHQAYGRSATINKAGSLNCVDGDADNYGNRSDGKTAARNTTPYVRYDSGDDTRFVRLFPDGQNWDNGNNPNGTTKGRGWTRLTLFETNYQPKVDDIRYAVIIYRLHGTMHHDKMGLTINSFDETNGNMSEYIKIDQTGSDQWRCAIIDLLGLKNHKGEIKSGTVVKEVYLQTPMATTATSSTSTVDVAAVAYFPYYGDAEQFSHLGLTLGCKQEYFNANNAGFSLRNNTNTHYSLTASDRTKVLVKSLPTFFTDSNYASYVGSRPMGINTYGEHKGTTTTRDVRDLTDLLNLNADGTANTILESTGIQLFGKITGQATLGMVEPTLGEDGRPVFRKSVVQYLATYLRHQLLTIPEYPSDNHGWKNYSYITGVSTNDGTRRALFGKDEYGQPMDLATALCKQIGVEKGGAVKTGSGDFGAGSADYSGTYDYSLTGSSNAYLGSYSDTLAHKDELIGTWNKCKGNIHTWYDAAYFLLQNLYVSQSDAADSVIDGYGDYENTYQTMIMPQVQYTKDGSTTMAYFFDSGYVNYTGSNSADDTKWTSAVVLNSTDHTITFDKNAKGAGRYNVTAGQLATSWFPFLPTSGNGKATGESNTPYYLHEGAISREASGTTYHNRDFHYSLTGAGQFAYEPNLYFEFQGDDDVFVYINGQLVIDLGGTHGAANYRMNLDDYVNWAKGIRDNGEKFNGKTYAQLSKADKARVDALCLVTGSVYSFDFFYMERHGHGSNLRIITNMKIVEPGLDVNKQAWQDDTEIANHGLFDASKTVEFGFSITNNSGAKLYNLSFRDDKLGLSMDHVNGLQVIGDLKDAMGAPLTPAGLQITVDGYDSGGSKLDTVYVSCPSNESLINFLKDLEAAGTGSGDAEDDYDELFAKSGLWKNATVTIRGIYYTLTKDEAALNSYTNSVTASGIRKVNTDGGLEDTVVWGYDRQVMYQPGKPSYYQWAGHPIVIESEQLYQDLIDGKIVANATELPDPRDMILIPSDADGVEVQTGNLTNIPGGNVYLEVNYDTPGSYREFVTIRSASNDSFSLTVPISIYAIGTKDSSVVLDYGLDTYLTKDNAIFDYELGTATSVDAEATLLGIGASSITPGYQEYNQSLIQQAAGQIANRAKIINGTYDASTGGNTKAVYELEKPIFLDHNKPWVLEWKVTQNNGSLLFSEMATSADGNKYVFVSKAGGRIMMGEDSQKVITETTSGTSGSVYNNFGVATPSSVPTAAVYKLVNKPDGYGGNKIYAYADDVALGQLNTYYPNNRTSDVTSEWLSGKDFNFKYLGTTGHPLADAYEYIRVYEDGYQLTNYQWTMTNQASASTNGLKSATSGGVGFVVNAPGTRLTHDVNGTTKYRYPLAESVTLAHDQNWEMSLTVSGISVGTIVLGAGESSVTNATHLYFHPGYSRINLGYKIDASLGGSHTNFAADISDVIPDFDMSQEHTYVLKNVVLPTGGNMVYLYIDGQYIGPMDHKLRGSNESLDTNSDEISGIDFTYAYVGDTTYGLQDTCKISNLTIKTKTALNNTYEWVAGGNGLVSNVATDPSGNQIIFNGETDGSMTTGDGRFLQDSNGLKFVVNDIMDTSSTIYVALAVHDKGFAATPLAQDAIDISHEAQMYKKVSVLPASVVYYEDDFPAIHYYGTAQNSFADLGNVSNDYSDYSDTYYYQQGSSEGMSQNADQNAPYGSDGVYQNVFANTSGGSLHTVAINNDGPLAWFKFKGTGFELLSRTTATDTGMIFVEVYNASDVTLDADGNPAIADGFIDGTPLDIIPVIPVFDQGNTVNGTFEAGNGGQETIYQVPIMDYSDLTYGEYIVVICGSENIDYSNTDLDPSDPNWNTGVHKDTYFYLDGIRIFNPLNTTQSSYKDVYGAQNNMVFEEIRNQIVEGNILVTDLYVGEEMKIGTGLMTWTEKYNTTDYTKKNVYVGHAVNNVNDYLLEGPNREVYLDGTFTNGALVMYVRHVGGEQTQLHVGVRALDAGLYYGAGSTGMRANLMMGVQSSGSGEYGWYYISTVSSGTEQYYNIPYTLAPTVKIGDNWYHQVVLTVSQYNDSIPAMLSFTNLKCASGLELASGSFLAADITNASGNLVMSTESIGYKLLSNVVSQMSSYRVLSLNESLPGASFEPETEIPEDAPAILPSYPSLSFEGEVRYNIYFETANMSDVDMEDMGLIVFDTALDNGTMQDAIDVVHGALFNGTHYVVHTNGISAKNLGDTLYLKVYAKQADGTYAYSRLIKYSALTYANSVLNAEGKDEIKPLVVAMLNYGAAAQKFFDYRTDALMNAGLTEEQKALVAAYNAEMSTPVVKTDASKVGAFASTGGFKSGYASVSFTGAFMLNYYFAPDKAVEGTVTMYTWDANTYNSVSELTAENATMVQTMTGNGNGEYVGTVTGMAAKEIGKTVYVAVVYRAGGEAYCSGVVAYNIDSYCARYATSTGSDMQELAAATTVYGYYAKNYFAN